MATLSRATFDTTYSNASGTFADNTTRDITEADLRQFADDISDSFVNLTDDTSNTVSGSTQLDASGKLVRQYPIGTFRRSLQITSSQILSGNSVPIEIVPAPGTGLVLVPVMFFCFLDYNSAAYATNTNFRFEMNGVAITATETAILDSTSDKFMIRAPLDSITTTTDLKNKSIVLEVQTGNPTAGNSPLFVTCIYRVVPTAEEV